MTEKNTLPLCVYLCVCVCSLTVLTGNISESLSWLGKQGSVLGTHFLLESACSFLTWSSRGRSWLGETQSTCAGVKCERGCDSHAFPAGSSGALCGGAGPAEFSTAHQRGGDTVRHHADRGPGSRVPPAGLAGLPAAAVGDPGLQFNNVVNKLRLVEQVSAGRWVAEKTMEEKVNPRTGRQSSRAAKEMQLHQMKVLLVWIPDVCQTMIALHSLFSSAI